MEKLHNLPQCPPGDHNPSPVEDKEEEPVRALSCAELVPDTSVAVCRMILPLVPHLGPTKVGP